MKEKGIINKLTLFGALLVLSMVFALAGGTVNTHAAETGVRLNVTEAAIAKDAVFRLRAYNVPQNARLIYRSSDVSVAYVDSRGYITGISCGDCVVTAIVAVGNSPSQTLKCNVTVGPAAISIKFIKSEMVLKVGMKKMLKSIVSPLNTVEKPVFYSSDKNVASVTSIGRVRAKGLGEAVIYAFLMNGESAECQIYVLTEEQYEEYIEKGNLEEILEGISEDVEDPDESDDNHKEGSEESEKADN